MQNVLALLVFHVAYCHGFVNYATLVFMFQVHDSLKFLSTTRNAHFIVLQIAYLVIYVELPLKRSLTN